MQTPLLDDMEPRTRMGLHGPCKSVRRNTVYITDEVFAAVYSHANAQLRDAMDMAYLTGQRPADALQMTSHDIVEGHLIITEQKTKQPLRIEIRGELADFLHRIETRKEGHKIVTAALLVNAHGRRLTAPALRSSFDKAKIAAAAAMPGLAVSSKHSGSMISGPRSQTTHQTIAATRRQVTSSTRQRQDHAEALFTQG
jgi:integrase